MIIFGHIKEGKYNHYVEYFTCGDHMNRVRKVRMERGLTQQELSKATKVSQKNISLIENDQKPNFSLAVAQRIAKALGETVDYLWPNL